jgi:hypothetical protein
MSPMLINNNKQLRYSVICETGTELRKFHTLKVAIAYSIVKEGIIIARKIRV